jgi:putative pyruvate formate lyase activating enzyme
MFCSVETMEILADLIDLWLPDFKFWDNDCARRFMWVGAKSGYREAAERNHLIAAKHGSMIVRHLVMPNHFECCTQPILRFIAENMRDSTLVNVMAQYFPSNLVEREPEKYVEIARKPSVEEIRRVYLYAQSLGLEFTHVS